MNRRQRSPLSSRNRLLYGLSVFARRLVRHLSWRLGGTSFARRHADRPLSETVISHRSLLLRQLQGTDQTLQRNKVSSLRIAAGLIDGLVIHPGESFSFWRIVGRPKEKRGFKPGLQLSFGRMKAMTGGGLCQLSNLLHWMVLHTPMEVTERHRHSFDPFPDYRRRVPFGSGATVFYNYLDLTFRNGSPLRFQLRTWVGDEYLHGEIRCDSRLQREFRVEERNHRFVRRNGEVYRENELWRIIIDPGSSNVIDEELLIRNSAQVRYDVSSVGDLEIEEGDSRPPQ
jgi:vancomycin resistance protein VanW